MKILVFYVSFSCDKNDFTKKLKKLKKFLKKKFIKNFEICIVNNNQKFLLETKNKNKEKIYNRNNSYFDFGAWNFLLQIKNKKIDKYDWILLTNDTFDQDYICHLKLFDKTKLEILKGQKVAVGHLDAYTKKETFAKVSLFGKTSAYWIRTSFLLINSSFFSNINSLIFIKKKNIFKKNSLKIDHKSLKISSNYLNQINFWLFGTNPKKKLSNAYRNQKKNLSKIYIKNKISTILNEFYLSRKIEELGYKIFDIEWLYYKNNYTNPIKQIKFAAKKRFNQNIKNP